MQSARTMSEAIAVLKNRFEQGIAIDSYMYVHVLKLCLKEKDLTSIKQVHDYITQRGMEQNIFVANNLLIVYIGCGRLLDARRVFDDLVKKDVISWNIMIRGYAHQSGAKDAMEVFNQMRQQGAEPNEITYLNILKSCASPSALNFGKEVHKHIRQSGLESDVRVATALLQMYAECGCIEEARQAFDRMKERNVITWTAMIGAYAKNGLDAEAYRLLLQMKREGYKPNAFTYTSILNAPATSTGSGLEWVKEVHRHIRDAGLESDLRVGNALVHMYAKTGCIDDAQRVFDRMGFKQRDVITWTAMIGGLAQHGRGQEAYHLFLAMEKEGLKPNAITYTSILNASASAGAVEWVKEVHRHAREAGLESDLRVGSALIHMYAKSGCIDDAHLLFNRMEKRDVVTWTAMIGGLAQHGCGQEALELFRRMNAEGMQPSETTFVAVLSACSHAGLVEEGRRLFSAMSTQEYGITPNVVHCNCMVDLLGRAGHLEEAKRFIDIMPVEPDEATWGALLGACRTFANVELGELAARERVKLLPKDASTYVLLSNIYATAGKWEEVLAVRTQMQERGIRKQPGRSWIVVDNKVHEFVVGDTAHPQAGEIYAELNRLTEEIKAVGYVPDTRVVLKKNMIDSEEDKELALCSHSEKLAIVYGLLQGQGVNSSRLGEPDRPIFVYKNLRVCADCHAATKFISKVTRRDIVVRDANRFHHFKAGSCSCDDYW